MSKNIEINYKDDTGYEILYPTTIPDQVLNLLTDSTKTYIGLDPSATPDDAFRSLYLLNVLSDKASFRLTIIRSTDSAPLSNIPVKSTSFIDGNGNPVSGPLYTNKNGVIDTFFKPGSVTVSVDTVADLVEWNQSYEILNGEQYSYNISLAPRNFVRYTSSKNIRFSSNVEQVDISAVGAGGAGGDGDGDEVERERKAGGGGGGGYVATQEAVSFEINTDYSLVVAARSTKSAGGNSSFLGVIGQGGEKGGNAVANASTPIDGSGGAGNGNGGNGAFGGTPGNGGNAYQQGYSSFTEMAYYGGGGGGGNGAGNHNATGGSPYGGAGNGSNGKNYGGGGGGGVGTYTGGDGGKGAQGCVAIRMHLKAT